MSDRLTLNLGLALRIRRARPATPRTATCAGSIPNAADQHRRRRSQAAYAAQSDSADRAVGIQRARRAAVRVRTRIPDSGMPTRTTSQPRVGLAYKLSESTVRARWLRRLHRPVHHLRQLPARLLADHDDRSVKRPRPDVQRQRSPIRFRAASPLPAGLVARRRHVPRPGSEQRVGRAVRAASTSRTRRTCAT